MNTIRKCDNCLDVAVAKALMGYSEYSREFTADFETYVKKWQKEQNLSVDGIIGKDSWKELVDDAKTVSTSKNRKSNWAAAAQLLTGAACDSIYGSKTKAAIAAAQKAGGLTADGICGPKTWSLLVLGVVEKHTQNKQPVIYRQGDSRWKNYYYGVKGSKSPTCGAAGCGPTCAAMLLATWVDSKIIPPDMCDYSMEHGYRTANSGTSATLFKSIAKTYFGNDYGNNKYFTSSNINDVIKTLDAGGLVVACMGPGKFTSSGHYILLWKVSEDGTKIMVNDPASAASNRTYGTINEIKTQRKGFYCFPKPDNIK